LTVNPLPTITITPSNGGAFCGSGTLTASGAVSYVWSPANQLLSNTGATVTSIATANTTFSVIGTGANGCTNTQTQAITYTAPTPVTLSASPASFCGTGGTTTLSASSANPNYSYVWAALNGATISNVQPTSVDATVAQTSAFQVTATDGACVNIQYQSIGVYPLPAATMSLSGNNLCPGAAVTVNSGLSAGNFASTSIPHAPLPAPANAVVLATGGAAVVPQTVVSLDDGGWGGVPMGFNFNFFGVSYNAISVGTNGTLQFGTTSGLGDYSFTTLPSTTEPLNMVAVLAMDNDLSTSGTANGTIRYWTEGYAPNRKFVVQYLNVREYGDTKVSTAQAIFYETTGVIEVHVTSSTNVDRNKLVGINDPTGTIGVLAFASGTIAAANNPIVTPFAYRFQPPSNYTTTWSTGQTGTNIFSINVNPPAGSTTYSLSYTNTTTNCANLPGSAQITYTAATPITAATIAPASPSACPAAPVTLTATPTDGVAPYTYQWYDPSNAPLGTASTQAAGTPGTYSVLITDACGTSATFTKVVTLNPGITAATITPATAFLCTGGSVTLTATPTDGAAPYTFQWSSGPVGGPYTPISGATSASYSANALGEYQVVVTDACGGSVTLTKAVSAAPVYACTCIPTSSSTSCLTNVTFGPTLNNTTGCVPTSPYYINYFGAGAGTTGTFAQGATYTLSLTTDASAITSVWIDYNNNGTYETTEWVQPMTTGTTGTVNITIPLTATPGTVGMRVRSRASGNTNGAANACSTFGSGECEDYAITITVPPPCGTPVPGATVSSVPSVCSGSNFTLSIPSLPVQAGYTYQWQSSPNGTTWTSISGATLSALTTSQTTATYYQCVVTCSNGGSSAPSTPLQVTMNAATACYCSSGATTVYDEEISNVTFNGTPNNSDCVTPGPGPGSVLAQYANYRSLGSLWSFQHASTVNFSITEDVCNSGSSYGTGIGIWIDYNQDGIFDDNTEKVFVESSLNSGTRTGSFVIPVTATVGTTGLRVTLAEGFTGSSLTSCLSYGYGETEDYLITIAPLPACTGAVGGTAAASVTSGCGLVTSSTLSVTGGSNPSVNSGLSFQWFSGPVGGPYTAIAGATGETYTATNVGSTTEYYRTTTCAGNGSANSTIVTITITGAGISITSSEPNFCGVGGTTTLTAVSTYPNWSYTWAALNGATLSSLTGPTTNATVSQTSAVQLTATDNVSSCTLTTVVSIGVYPLPSATMSLSANNQCAGATITVNSGLSSGNFAVASITHAPRTAPITAVNLADGGVDYGGLASGSLDDGGWAGIPIGFSFNYFGNSYSSINVGTNGTMQFGPYNGNGGFTPPYGLGDYSFTTLPSTGEPANVIAACAHDNYLTSGTVRYWTEGYAPNRVFVVEYANVPAWNGSGTASVQTHLFETLGTVEIHVINDNTSYNHLVGLQNLSQTIGAITNNSSTLLTATSWRFTPPSNYNTTWSINGAPQTPGTNVFSITDTPGAGSTVYEVIYTNQTTGCSNDPGTATITYTQGTPITAATISPATPSLCVGQSTTITAAATDGVAPYTYQWSSGPVGGPYTPITGATSASYVVTALGDYRVVVTDACGVSAPPVTVTVTANSFLNCYCSSGATSTSDEEIYSVSFNGSPFGNGAADCGVTATGPGSIAYRYSNHKDLGPLWTFTQGLPISFNVVEDECDGSFYYAFGTAIWIDLNQDGIFDDVTEKLFVENTTATGPRTVSNTFTIPFGATPGVTAMRITVAENLSGAGLTSCLSYGYGETEDYLVNIAAGNNNYTCATAAPLTCFDIQQAYLTGTSTLPPTACAFNGAPSTGGTTWWIYTASTNDDVRFKVTTLPSFDVRLSAFRPVPDCNNLVCIGAVDNTPGYGGGGELKVACSPGDVIYLAVHGVTGISGVITVETDCTSPCAVPATNDLCAGASDITPPTYTPVTLVDNNTCAYVDGPTLQSGTGPVQGLWYTFNSGVNSLARLYLGAPGTATGLRYALFDGACNGLSAGNEVANGVIPPGGAFNNLAVTPGTQYRLLAYNSGGTAEGTYTLSLELPPLVDAAITEISSPTGTICGTQIQPVVKLKNLGETNLTGAVIEVSIDGGAPVLSYNWVGNLPFLGEVTVNLPLVNTPTGPHTLNVRAVVAGDQRTSNDQLNSSYSADGQQVVVRVTTDNNPGEITWTIFGPAPTYPIYAQSPPYFVANTTASSTQCLPNGGRYNFSLSDGGLDGINAGSAGGWELRNAFGRTILQDNGNFTSITPNNPPATAGYNLHEVTLPLGPTSIWTAAPYTVCGNYAMGIQNKIRCTTASGASQYQFEFSDPNAGYRRRVSATTNYVLWTSMGGNAPQLGVRYFVRSRADQGAAGFGDDNWGSGCEMAWATTSPSFCTSLISTPGSTLSCGVSRTFGGSSKLWATPVPGAVPYDADGNGSVLDPGDQQYAYHFRITGVTNPLYVKDAWMTNYILPLVWSTDPMTPGVYNVQVRVQVGGVWQPFCGNSCQVTIIPSGPVQGGNDRAVVTTTGEDLQLWPNPVRDGRVTLRIEGITDADQRITVDVYDAFGKRVLAEQYANSGALFNAALDLGRDMAAGLYTVHVTINDRTYVKRLSVL